MWDALGEEWEPAAGLTPRRREQTVQPTGAHGVASPPETFYAEFRWVVAETFILPGKRPTGGIWG